MIAELIRACRTIWGMLPPLTRSTLAKTWLHTLNITVLNGINLIAKAEWTKWLFLAGGMASTLWMGWEALKLQRLVKQELDPPRRPAPLPDPEEPDADDDDPGQVRRGGFGTRKT